MVFNTRNSSGLANRDELSALSTSLALGGWKIQEDDRVILTMSADRVRCRCFHALLKPGSGAEGVH
jgi:hypothetical protein